ncbi:hypothetical protein [Nocardia sp. NPDC058480]|uniref:hypothetical protein n=1 Tax=Nocardia sp. NPDC058480 TaxID=3346522 RepID=UPI00364B1C12
MPNTNQPTRPRRPNRVSRLKPQRKPSTRERFTKRWLDAISGLGRTSKLAIGLALTAALSGVIGIVGTTYGPDLGDQIRLGPPLKSVVQHEIGEKGHTYALPGIIPDNPASVPLANLRDIISQHRGVTVSPLRLKLIVEGARNSTVTIADIVLRVTKRSAPHAGTLIVAKGQGSEQNLRGCVDISSQLPKVIQREDGGSCAESAKPYFDGNRVELKLGEQYVIDLEIYAPSESDHLGYYEFELVLRTIVSGQAVDITVKDGDSPFAVSSYAGAYSDIFGRLTSTKDGVQRSDSVDACDPLCHPVPRK